MSILKRVCYVLSCSIICTVAFSGLSAAHGATITLIDGSTLNGGFEDGTGLPFSDTDDWTNFTGNQSINSRLSSSAYSGTYSGLVGHFTSNDYENANDTNLGGSGYTISLGDSYDLSFWHLAAGGWTSGVDSYEWELLYTSDDTIGGAVTVLFSGSVTPTTTYAQEIIPTTAAVADAGANGKNLWLRYSYASVADVTKLARVDDVILSVNLAPAPEPSSLVLASLGMIGLGLCRRRRRS